MQRAQSKQPPLVQGLPVLGNALTLTRDPLSNVLNWYHDYGPIFRIRIINREYVVMGGIKANQFFARYNDEHLQAKEIYEGMGDELGSKEFLAALDGEPHRMYRKIMRPGFSRERFLERLPEMVEIVREYVKPLQPGEDVYLLRWFQRMVTDQLGLLLTGSRPEEHFEDLIHFFERIMGVHVLKCGPGFS